MTSNKKWIVRRSKIHGHGVFASSDIKKGAKIIEVFIDKNQKFEPKLISSKNKNGKIITPKLHEMYPYLSYDEFQENIFNKLAK